jgi:hypothetical protein
VYYNVLANFNSNTKFISFYLPSSNDTLKFIYYLKDAGADIINSVDKTINFKTKNVLNTSSVDLKDFMFSRTAHIFYENDILDLKNISDLTDLYKANNELVQFHSTDYKLRVWDEIKLGRVSKVRAYEIRDGLVQPVRKN